MSSTPQGPGGNPSSRGTFFLLIFPNYLKRHYKCVGYTYVTSRSRCDLKDESGLGGGLEEINGLIAGLREKGKDLHKGLF